jgi:hypothetical protein
MMAAVIVRKKEGMTQLQLLLRLLLQFRTRMLGLVPTMLVRILRRIVASLLLY